jgi:hypothetical protein
MTNHPHIHTEHLPPPLLAFPSLAMSHYLSALALQSETEEVHSFGCCQLQSGKSSTMPIQRLFGT